MPYRFLVLFALSSLFAFAQQQVKMTWNNIPFMLDSTYLLNDTLQFQISQCKFYVQGEPQNGSNAIHLIDASNQETWQWEDPSAALQVGIGAELQTAGVFTGALDPINGMYWAWNSGFISVKCVGEFSNLKTGLTQTFEFHLGGYQAPFACIMAIPGSGTNLKCDLHAWFRTILATPALGLKIMQPSKASLTLFELFTSALSYAK
jgi:hypothetical protein